MQQIPSVDLRDFLSGEPTRKQKFVNEIGTAYEEIGFVALKGHFLNDELVTDLYKEVKSFFDLPLETKKNYEIEGIGGQRGYVSFGKEHAKGRSAGDLKEFWHFGQDFKTKPFLEGKYSKNLLVKELENFNKVGNLVFLKLEETAKVLLQALALYLDLNEYYFDAYVTGGNSILRAIHYPPIKEPPKEAVRAAAHGDINLITLLMGAQGGGLQVLNRQNQWIDAVAERDELMINIGDMLSRLTNNKLPSTVHRVVNPPKELWGKSRYSLPFFMHPTPEMPLNCLPQTVDKDHPKKYEDIQAGTFLNQRLVALGLLEK